VPAPELPLEVGHRAQAKATQALHHGMDQHRLSFQ
jgi:hypothetical protein